MWLTAAFAAVVVGSMFHLNSQMFHLNSQMFRLNSQMGAQVLQVEERIMARFDVLATRVDGLTTRVDGLTTRVDRLADSVDGQILQMEALTTRVDRLADSVEGLLVSTLTPAAAQATLACAEASIYVLFTWISAWNSTLGAVQARFAPCSAFAYSTLNGGGTVVVSASHCFTNGSNSAAINATRLALARETRVKCRLLKTFPASDSAVLRCEDAAPPLRRTLRAPVFAQAAVAAGFFKGPVSNYPPTLSVHDDFAMHVLSSSIAVSLGPVTAKWAAPGGGSLPRTRAQSSFGMLQGRVLQGMSGGPVLDVHCGVVGIISAFSTNTDFGTLDEVDAWLQHEDWAAPLGLMM
jgi:hypothetical protein